jgi:hypothetical protein
MNVRMYMYVHTAVYDVVHMHVYVCVGTRSISMSRSESFCTTAILMIFEGQFQAFQRFSSSKLVLKKC